LFNVIILLLFFKISLFENFNSTFSFQYKEFISALERLAEHPFSYRVKDFIFRFRIPISTLQSMDTFVAPELDEEGKAFVEAIGGMKLMKVIISSCYKSE
jgi:hypothetical protein